MHDYRRIAVVLRDSPTTAAAAETLGLTVAALSAIAYRLRKRYPLSFPRRQPGRPKAPFDPALASGDLPPLAGGEPT